MDKIIKQGKDKNKLDKKLRNVMERNDERFERKQKRWRKISEQIQLKQSKLEVQSSLVNLIPERLKKGSLDNTVGEQVEKQTDEDNVFIHGEGNKNSNNITLMSLMPLSPNQIIKELCQK